MDKTDIVGLYRKVENITDSYQSLVELELPNLKQEHGIEEADVIQKIINEKEKKGRLLCIGIVGRVKAGKSSLLNALFFDGKEVLPKAATPMTAALTTLSYGEHVSAKIDFYSTDDIARIKKIHDDYERQFNQIVTEKVKLIKSASRDQSSSKKRSESPEEIAQRIAKRELLRNVELSANYEQYEKIKESEKKDGGIKQSRTINVSDFEQLHSNLQDYVGVNGHYMPFTKSVDIQLPLESLEEIKIVDTPGMNDPVQSREERTRSLLRECDVTFIISPAGQFLHKPDLELMDMITRKKGISELYVVSSMVDYQLFGGEVYKKYGVLSDVLEGITEDLSSHMRKTFSDLKTNNEEVGTMFDQLVEQGTERLIHTSGICHAIGMFFNQRDKWDDSMRTVWGNLVENYPDYFSDKDTKLSLDWLSKLSNIERIKEVLYSVRSKKEATLAKSRDEYVASQKSCLTKYIESLISFAEYRMKTIEDSDADSINVQKKSLEKTEKIGSTTIKNEYAELIESMEIEVELRLIEVIKSFFRETTDTLDNAEGEKVETWTTGLWLWKKNHSQEVTTVKAGAVRNALDALITDIEFQISAESKMFFSEWRKKLCSELLKTLRSKIDDENIDDQMLRTAIRTMFNKIDSPSIVFDNELPESLKCNGTLEDERAETFIGDARAYLTKTRKMCLKAIKKYGLDLVTGLRSIDPSDKLFASCREQILSLEEQIRCRETSLNSYKRFISKLKESLNEV